MATEKEIKKVLNWLTTVPQAKVESLKAAKRSHTEDLRRKVEQKNIVGLGISEKVTGNKRTGKLALTFYVEKKINAKKLFGNQIIPPAVPESLSGKKTIPTDVVAIGKIRPEVNAIKRPVQPGNSIGHIAVTAGTFGAVVADKSNNIFILSNSHVLAKSGKAKKGDVIVYPGKADGGKNPADFVGSLHKFKPFIPGGEFTNHVDCALAKPDKQRLADLVAEIKGLGLPKGIIAPKRGMKIIKVGRTTGKTTGEVLDINFRFTLDYEEPGLREVGFTDQVLCSRYTEGGDSGSLVLDAKSGKAVGLHFAGANGGSVFNPIDKVLSTLGVNLVTKPMKKPSAMKKSGTRKNKKSITKNNK